MTRQTLIEAVDGWIDRQPGHGPFHDGPVEGLRFMRTAAPVSPEPIIYQPQICLNLRGAKQLLIGDRIVDYDEMQFLLLSIDLPVRGRVTRIGEASTFLGLILEIDIGAMVKVAERAALDRPPEERAGPGLFVADLTGDMMDAIERLMRLSDRPEAIPVLAPAIKDELYYWLLTGPYGRDVRRLFPADSHAQRIARAIAAIREDLTAPVSVPELAGLSGMSVSSFHQHFRTVTSMSPIQYQKRLRLLSARDIMLCEGVNVSQAAFRVGYESPSQFSREYARTFGAPPRRDIEQINPA
ncbi:AraC family transcriptional regulator [Henriciella aquimarina]|uniref:AraC family transcriptional regulator n=1 Tax=Henriciella aquimarina TaxID=545261 RepID=UPI0009FCE3C8|nr:AraC family transcriptional regulator [Henriciella aquimarina]